MSTPALRTTGVLAALLAALTLILPQEVSAQYFGRNQVQYRGFDFRVMETENFDVYFYPEEEAAVRDVGRMAERWYARLSNILDHRFEQRQPLIMYAAHPHFQQTNITSIGETTGGVTEAFKQRVVLPFAYSYSETDHVLGHELVHAFQYDISGLGRAGGGIEAAARRYQVPLWFSEGMAEYLSVGPVDPHTAMWLRDGALRGEIPSIEQMTMGRVDPYQWGQALWAYIGGRWGDAVIGQLLKLAGEGVPYPLAFERILNISLDELSGDWHASIRRAFLPMLADRPEAREIASPLITGEGEGGRYNVGPVVSPDGNWLVFLSELDFIDVQLHLADARTGEVVRTLQKGSVFDPHFGSLRYVSSAGTWSPDSRQFAFAALRKGRDVIVLIDVERARRLREIAIPGVDEITNPAWSPDGSTIAFTGLSGGITDLFMVDLETEAVTKLTDDRYSELHAAWSPDGSTIAFSTDRGPETSFEEMDYGPFRLATMDVASRQITLLPEMGGTMDVNPQWTTDGAGVLFISTRNGIPNIYRYDIASNQLFQVTDLFIGVSGITAVSPALSLARNGSRLAFTEFNENGYNIYALTDADEIAGEPIPLEPEPVDPTLPEPGLLPPTPRPSEGAFNRVTQMLNDAQTGLPSVSESLAWGESGYRPRLGLDYLGQPQVGVSVGGGAFGQGGLYGGIFGIFSDLLARHQVYAAVQAQGQVDEVGFAVQYFNQRERWNFGGAAQRVPLVYGGYTRFIDPAEPSLVVDRIARIRLFDSSIQGFAQYPFSPVQRVEFSGGLRRIARDLQFYDYAYDRNTGIYVGERRTEEEGINLNLFETTAALVYDSSLLGYTSPFAGQRYRFQVTPTLGELQFVQALGDYRRYLFANPFTLAVRGLHVGRYGRDAEATRDGEEVFQDLYLGQPWYVRGYSNVWQDCQENRGSTNDCTVLSQLLGSRIAVASAELRFPLIRQLVIGNAIGLPPIEGVLFGDAGISWGQDSNPTFIRGVPSASNERGIMTSAGVGARINLLGIVIMEIDYVNAFAREQGWHWQFGFVPGF